MEKSAIVVLRILVIIACAVLVTAGIYLYCVRNINAYYAPSGGEVFLSSMTVKNILPMNSGCTAVCGTYLGGDSVYGNPSVFFKIYDKSGKIKKTSGMELEEGFDYYGTACDGDRILLTLKNPRGDVAAYVLTEDLEAEAMEKRSFSADVTGIYTGLVHGRMFVAEVRNGYSALVKCGDEIIIDADFSEDVFINNVFFAGNTFYLTGKTDTGETTSSFISGFSLSGYRKFGTVVPLADRDFYIDGVVFTADGKTYVTGKKFNREAYLAAAGMSEDSPEGAEAVIDRIGDRAVLSKRDFGAVLIGGADYETDPWCSRFIWNIDAETGTLAEGGLTVILEDGPDLGITEIYYRDAYVLKNGAATDNPGGKPVIAAVVTKNAPSAAASEYTVNVFLLYEDMTVSRSANIVVPSESYYYPGPLADGTLFAYTGILGSGNRIIYSMKNYGGTESAAEVQRKLPVYKEIANYMVSKLTPGMLAYTGLFLLLYITARYRGTENAKKVRENSC